MKRLRGSLPAFLLLALLASLPESADAVEVEARLDPTLIGVGQLATLTLEAKVEGGLDLEIEPHFSLENFEIVAGPSQSQQVSFVNGRISRSQSLTWTLRALDIGTARVHGLRLSVNDEVFELPEQVIEVQEKAIEQSEQSDIYGRPRRSIDPFEDFFDPMRRRRRQTADAPEPKLFLRAEASPRNPYVGQQVLYSLLLFTQADIGAVSPDEMPDFEGMWTVDIEQPRRPKSVMTEVQGERYGRVVLLQKALFPLRAGKVQLDPVEARLVAKIPDYSWMGIVGSYDKEVALSSNALTLDVRPIPDPPPAFSGAVGSFELDAELEPAEIHLGEAATLTITLSGRGHVDGLAAPALPQLDGVKIYPPQQSGGDRAAGTTVHGEKKWSHILVPERSGVWEIEAPRYSFFDPQTAEHRATEAQTRVLVVRGDAASSGSTGPSGVQPAEPDAMSPPDGGSPATAPWKSGVGYRFPIKVFLLGVAALALAALLFRLLRRQIERRRLTVHLRQELERAAGLEKPRAAAQAIEEAWRAFLHQRWSVATSLSPGEWASVLEEQGVTADSVDQLTKLVDDLHYLRYAPELSAYQSLKLELVDESLRLARSVC